MHRNRTEYERTRVHVHERTEVMFLVRVVVLRERVERPHRFERTALDVGRERIDAGGQTLPPWSVVRN